MGLWLVERGVNREIAPVAQWGSTMKINSSSLALMRESLRETTDFDCKDTYRVHCLTDFIGDESGKGITQYGLKLAILAAVAGACFGAWSVHDGSNDSPEGTQSIFGKAKNPPRQYSCQGDCGMG